MIRAATYLFVLALFPATTLAQSTVITGRVIDINGNPLPGAHLFVEEFPATGDVSAGDGSFEIIIATDSAVTLTCTIVGFEDFRMRIAPDDEIADNLQIVMRDSWHLAEEVVVTASRRAQVATSVPASIAVIPNDELVRRNVRSLDDALRTVSGVHVQDNQINIRGSSGFSYNTGSKVLLLVDGAPMLTPDSDGVPLDLIPSHRIKQIEILKGTGSSLYGSGAIGGIINIITRPAGDSELLVETDLGVYSPFRHKSWTDRWSGSGTRPFGTISVAGGTTLSSRASGWITASFLGDRGFRNENTERRLQLLSRLDWEPSFRWSTSLLTSFTNRRKDNFLFWAGLADPLNPGTISISESGSPGGASDNASNRLSIFPSVTYHPDSQSYVTARGRVYAIGIRPIDEDGNAKALSEGTIGFRGGATVQYNRQMGLGQHLTLGAAVDANSTSSSFFRTANGNKIGSQPEAAVFGQWDIESARWSLVAGLRGDVYSVDTQETIGRLSPRLAVGARFSPALAVRASAGTGFRVPSLAERFTDDQSFFPIFRNADLEPETSVSAEVGMRAAARSTVASLVWDVALYWSRYENLIEPRFVRTTNEESELFGFQFVNLAAGRVAGVDATLSGDVRRRLQFSAGYLLVDSHDADTGRDLVYRPRHTGKVSVTGLPGFGLSIGVDFRLVSEPRSIDSDFARFVPDASTMTRITVFDFRMGYERNHVGLYFVIRNASDYYYLERPAIIAAPRTFSLRSRVTL